MIRTATHEDYSEIVSLHRKLYEFHHQHYPEVFKHHRTVQDPRSNELDIDKTLVSCESTRIVGFLSYGFHEVKESENLYRRNILIVFDLFTDESLRNQGIGHGLIKELRR